MSKSWKERPEKYKKFKDFKKKFSKKQKNHKDSHPMGTLPDEYEEQPR